MSLLRGRWLLVGLAAVLAMWVPLRIADPAVEAAVRPLLVAPKPVRAAPPADIAGVIARLDLAAASNSADAASLPADMAAAVPAPLPPLPTLVGTALAPRGRAVALARGSDGQVVTLSPGGEVDGWRLVRVGRGEVRFSRDGVTQPVRLNLSNRTPAGGSPPQTPPSPPASTLQDSAP